MSPNSLAYKAKEDFRRARQKAAIEGILARLSGQTTELLSYEDVRQKLRAVESNKTVLRNIPLDAIVGSVGRNKDFSRSFLPLSDSDIERWAGVMKATAGSTGLPPIDVYQIGEVYFVLDGNHRVSVARELNAKTIQAFVREVRTRVNITPDIKPDDLIIKAEELDFFERTQLDQARPETNFNTHQPGQYPMLLEHIEVHRYFMGLDEKREISYEEAVLHWHDEIYMPIVTLIRDRGILRHFPHRTEMELYLWISSHRAELEKNLNWQVSPENAVGDLTYHFSAEFSQRFSRLFSGILDAVIPDPLESGPPVGLWREEMEKRLQRQDDLFINILTLVSYNDPNWLALEQSLILAKRENGQIQGLHVTQDGAKTESEVHDQLEVEFESRCQAAGVQGTLAIAPGAVARTACDRSLWTDIIVTQVSFPPGDDPIARFASGLRTMIRRCPRPMLVVRKHISPLQHALLAYNGTPKSKEALYLAAYMRENWHIELSVLIIEHSEIDVDEIYAEAHDYLVKKHGLSVNFIRHAAGTRSDIILATAQEEGADFVLIGGYKSSSMVEVFLGSVVDAVLRKTEIPLLICR